MQNPISLKNDHRSMLDPSSQAKGTNLLHFVPYVRNEVELVPLACEDVLDLVKEIQPSNVSPVLIIFTPIVYGRLCVRYLFFVQYFVTMCGSRGGKGVRTPHPEKSQKYRVF